MPIVDGGNISLTADEAKLVRGMNAIGASRFGETIRTSNIGALFFDGPALAAMVVARRQPTIEEFRRNPGDFPKSHK